MSSAWTAEPQPGWSAYVTAKSAVEGLIRAGLRRDELISIVSSVGIPPGPSAVFTTNTGPHSASVQVYLTAGNARRRDDRAIVAALREAFVGKFPGASYRFVPGGLVARTINFGSDTAIDVEVLGYDLGAANGVAREVARVMESTAGLTDVTVSRDANYPQFEVAVDREKAASAGLSQRDVAQAALFSLNSNASVNPSVFTDPRTGNQYNLVVQLDESYRQTPDDLARLFVTANDRPVLLSTIAEIFPEARVIHCLRDGRDVAVSIQAAARSWAPQWRDRMGRNTFAAARSWRKVVDQVRAAEAEQAARHYCAAVPNSAIGQVIRRPPEVPGGDATPLMVNFTLAGAPMLAFNADPPPGRRRPR